VAVQWLNQVQCFYQSFCFVVQKDTSKSPITAYIRKFSGNNKGHRYNEKKMNKTDNAIAFIGGIHGVGKSTICQHICSELNLEYLSASELIKWKDINEDAKNKKVKDIPSTQNRLILGLNKTVQKGINYLLDGHYCLLNSDNEVVNIPLETFEKIKPVSLNIILGETLDIKKRLEIRDNKPYDKNLLEHLQNEELTYAKYLSKTLGISLNIGTQKDYSEILLLLRKTLPI
jgi:adenylate kinase